MKKLKKAFTIVELVIVIAVIAILAAVLIPTFTSIIRKANEASDTALAKNMNTVLSTAEAGGDAPADMEEVTYLMEQNGFKLENLNPTADGNVFVWNKATNRITYINRDKEVVYSGDNLASGSAFTASGDYWLTVKTAGDIEAWSGLSYYFADKQIADDTAVLTFSTPSSVDTGTYSYQGTITYTFTEEAEVSVYGHVNALTVNAPEATVNNYSSVDTVTVQQVGENSYHEYGYAKTLVVEDTAVKANIVIEKTGMVDKVDTKNAPASITFTNNGYVGMLNDQVVEGSANYVYEISTAEELASFRDKVNGGQTFAGLKVALKADVDISGKVWVPIAYDSRENYDRDGYLYFAGTFDGENHTVNGLSNQGFQPTVLRVDTYGTGSGVPEENNYLYGLFGILQDATVKNLNMTNVNIATEEILLDSVGAIAGFASGSVTIENCTASGSIEGQDAVAGIIGRIYTQDKAQKVVIKDCVNNATIVSHEDKAAGIVGYLYAEKGTPEQGTFFATMTGCENNGNVTAGAYAAGIGIVIAGPDQSAWTQFSDCTNNGQLKAPDSLGAIVAMGSSTQSCSASVTGCSSSFVLTASMATSVFDATGTLVQA